MNILHLTAEDINANEQIKEKWRNFIMSYEKKVAHYNFGSLIRLNASQGYTEENSYFGKYIKSIIIHYIIYY